MSTNHAFQRTFAATVLLGLVDWALPLAVAEKTYFFGFWLGYVLLVIFGFFAVREGRSYRQVFAFTWAFVALWLLLGLLSLAFDRGELPADWSPEKDRLAYYGYLLSTVVFLPAAFASAGIGVATA